MKKKQASQPTYAPSDPPSHNKQLTWVEPRGFRKAEWKDSKKSLLRIICLTVSVTVVFMFIANWLELDADMTIKLLVSAGGIIVLILCLGAILGLVRIVVKITDETIVWEYDETPTVYRFGTVDHCELGSMSVGNKTYSVLVVALKNGDGEIFCVDPSVSIEVLRSTLEQRGVNVVIRTDTMSEASLYD